MSTSKPIKPTLSPAATGVEGFMKIGKLINVIGILSVLMAVSVYAQESPPPPPAADFVASNWKEFISTDGSLSVLMPGIPTDVSQPVDTKSGSVAITLYALATRTAEYSVGYTTFAKNIETLQSSKLTLDGLRNRLAAKENGKVLDEQDIVSDGHPGRAVVIEILRNHAADRCGRTERFTCSPTVLAAIFRSYRVCKFSQNSAEVSK